MQQTCAAKRGGPHPALAGKRLCARHGGLLVSNVDPLEELRALVAATEIYRSVLNVLGPFGDWLRVNDPDVSAFFATGARLARILASLEEE